MSEGCGEADLKEEFSPTEEEVARARRVITAFEEALAAGKGTIGVNGRTVDFLVMEGTRVPLENLQGHPGAGSAW